MDFDGQLAVITAVNVALADDGIECDIPRVGPNAGNALAFVRQSDQARASPAAGTRAHWPETAVVESAPHAEALTCVVESDERHEYQIKRPRFDRTVDRELPTRIGFGNAEAIQVPSVWPPIRVKRERRGLQGDHDRQIPDQRAVPESMTDGTGVEFAVTRHIERDVPRALSAWQAHEACSDREGMAILRGFAERAAFGAQPLP